MEREDPSKSRGFGFVTFQNESDALAAQRDMNDQDLDGRRIRVDTQDGKGGKGKGKGQAKACDLEGGGGESCVYHAMMTNYSRNIGPAVYNEVTGQPC